MPAFGPQSPGHRDRQLSRDRGGSAPRGGRHGSDPPCNLPFIGRLSHRVSPHLSRPKDMVHRERNRWLAMGILCLGALMIVLDITIVNVALPSIRADLHFSEASLAWWQWGAAFSRPIRRT